MAKANRFVKSLLQSASHAAFINANVALSNKSKHLLNPAAFRTLQQLHQKRFYSPELPRRFYADVKVVQIEQPTRDHPGSWGINLDSKKLRTPNRNIFEVDNESVAQVVAYEWAKQKGNIMLNSMHMTSLANTAQDNPFHKTKFDICNDILSFLPLDTILYRAEENERLWELQREQWDPVLHWFQNTFDVKLPIVSGAITPPDVPEETLAVIRRELMSYRFDAMLGLQFATEALKSLVLCMAAAKMHLTSEEAIRLSRLELDFQIKHWGNVEWAHELEYHDTSSRFASGMMLFNLTTYTPFRYTETINNASNMPTFGNGGKEQQKST